MFLSSVQLKSHGIAKLVISAAKIQWETWFGNSEIIKVGRERNQAKKRRKGKENKTEQNMCSTRLIRNKLCKKVYTVLFILLYGLFSTTQAAISNRSNKSLGEWCFSWTFSSFTAFWHSERKSLEVMNTQVGFGIFYRGSTKGVRELPENLGSNQSFPQSPWPMSQIHLPGTSAHAARYLFLQRSEGWWSFQLITRILLTRCWIHYMSFSKAFFSLPSNSSCLLDVRWIAFKSEGNSLPRTRLASLRGNELNLNRAH